jgi:hypothetical protein
VTGTQRNPARYAPLICCVTSSPSPGNEDRSSSVSPTILTRAWMLVLLLANQGLVSLSPMFVKPRISLITWMAYVAERPRRPHELRLLWWALRGSNPRPSPCKGKTNPQVRAWPRPNRVPLSTSPYP